MAERRMFAKTIIDSDAFLDMPLSSQALYFHLSMRADDDGFINNPRKIQRMIGASDDDLKLLIAKRFLIIFESGVVVIKHWKIHNYIQSDRYKKTVYTDEKSMLGTKDNKSYTLLDTECIHDVYKMDTDGIPNGYSLETQDKLSKVSLVKDSIDNSISKDILVPKLLVPVVEKWNELKLSKVISVKGNRLKQLNARVNEFGIDEIIQAIESIKDSDFLKGQNNKNWIITFDWLIKPNNFIKVLEGNYLNKGVGEHGVRKTAEQELRENGIGFIIS